MKEGKAKLKKDGERSSAKSELEGRLSVAGWELSVQIMA